MSIKLHHDAKRRRRRRYSTLTLALVVLALMGWCLALRLLFVMGGA